MADGITIREFIHKVGFAVSLDGLNAYNKSLDRVEEKEKQMFAGADKLIRRLESLGKRLSLSLTLPITGLATVSVMARASQERMEAYWSGVLGGMDKGVEFTRRLKETAEGLPEAFTPEVVDEYAKSLRRLQTPVNDILPMIRKFADIEAGTGQNAGEMLTEYAQAKLNPIMRGRVLQRLMREGVVSEADLRKVGLNPLLMRREGGLDRLSMKPLDAIFNELALRNMGKAAAQSETLGKNFKNFWESITRVRESIGKMIEKVGHLNGILKAATLIIKDVAQWINNLPTGIKTIVLAVGTFLAVLGPAIFMISKFGGLILGAFKIMALLSLNPLNLEILAVMASLFMLLLIARQVNIEIRKWQGKDLATIAQGKFVAAGGSMSQWTGPQKGAVSDVTGVRPVFGTPAPMGRSAAQIFGGNNGPVNVSISNTVELHGATGTWGVESFKDAMTDISKKSAQDAVTKIQNAMR